MTELWNGFTSKLIERQKDKGMQERRLRIGERRRAWNREGHKQTHLKYQTLIYNIYQYLGHKPRVIKASKLGT